MKPRAPDVRPEDLTLARLAAYAAGELPDAEAAAVRAELATSPAARRALARIERLPALLAALPAPTLAPERRDEIGARAVALALRRRRVVLGAAVAGLAAAAIVVFYNRPPAPAPEVAGSFRTGPGDFQLLPLGERAVAFVGESTELVTYPGTTPALRVVRGSVRLLVRRGVAERFVVATAAAEVSVLGTEFDVTVTGEETEVTVVHGEVEVANPDGRRRLWSRESAVVRPGQPPKLMVPVRGIVEEGSPEIERPGP